MNPLPYRVVILGGYGNFGARIAQRLALCPEIELVIAGRNLGRAEAQAARLQGLAARPVRAQVLDAAGADFAQDLAASGARLLVHTCGPFQLQDYRVARACIEQGVHYIDLADGREFVAGFAAALDTQARQAGVVAISGASTVPGLSSAVTAHILPQFAQLRHIDYGIAPGNQAERGEATVAAILSYTGHPFLRLDVGRPRAVYGWQCNHRHRFAPPIGPRWLANCDIPDLALFPQAYPSLQTLQFYAGLELPVLHLAMAGMSWMARLGLVGNWARYAALITRLARWFERFGTDVGGMYMRFQGEDEHGHRIGWQWQLVAEEGDGPFIPAMPSVILARKLAAGRPVPAGARPCMGLFTLAEFDEAVSGLCIRHQWQPA